MSARRLEIIDRKMAIASRNGIVADRSVRREDDTHRPRGFVHLSLRLSKTDAGYAVIVDVGPPLPPTDHTVVAKELVALWLAATTGRISCAYRARR